jgi:hypothetical protein
LVVFRVLARKPMVVTWVADISEIREPVFS